MMWSPSETLLTPGPTSTTTPAPSCPRTDGKRPSGSDPLLVYSSVWHTPVDFISTSTSPAFGPSNCTVSTLRGSPAPKATAALMSIAYLLYVTQEHVSGSCSRSPIGLGFRHLPHLATRTTLPRAAGAGRCIAHRTESTPALYGTGYLI